MRLARSLENLIGELERLPGIGPKSAQRLALHILRMPSAQVGALAKSMVQAREKIAPCSRCGNLTDEIAAELSTDSQRDASIICVVEAASDVIAIERSGYRGRYFVLNQDPRLIESSSLESLNVKGLLEASRAGRLKEIIMATNPTIDGELTARYIAELVKPSGVRVTRLAHGLPVGGDIEYTDELTLRKALEGRQEV